MGLLPEIVLRLIVFFGIYIGWKVHKRGQLPVKIRGSQSPSFIYTGWRMYAVLGVTFLIIGLPVLIFGSQLFNIFDYSIHPLAFLWFWSSFLTLPLSWLIIGLAQMLHKRHRKRKPHID